MVVVVGGIVVVVVVGCVVVVVVVVGCVVVVVVVGVLWHVRMTTDRYGCCTCM